MLVALLGLVAASAISATPVEPPRGGVIARGLEHRLNTQPAAATRVWIFFADKGPGSVASARPATPPEHLTERAIARRAQRRTSPGTFDVRDLPVRPDYVAAVGRGGAHLRRTSRWLNAASAEATPAQIRALAALPFVTRIQPVGISTNSKPPVPQAAPAGDLTPRSTATLNYGASLAQLTQINAVAAHDAGYTGAGVIIGVLDSGFRREHSVFNQTTAPAHPVQIVAEYDFLNDDGNTAPQAGDATDQHYHGTWILGTMGAFQPGTLVGAAYNASFLLAKTEDVPFEYPQEEDNYVAGLEWIENNGGDLATSSLGYIDWYTQADLDGATAVTTLAVNAATDNGLICCTAAGNEGNDGNAAISHLIAPADALRVLTCGAVDSSGFVASFSSDGPSFDGRVKPEIMARGISTATCSAVSTTSIIGVSGTSLSTPLVAGGVALIVQAHPNWSVDKVRRALFHTAPGFEIGATYDLLYLQGYGIANIHGAIQFVHGDIDGNGTADGRDIRLFLAALNGSNGDFAQTRRSDVNADAAVTTADIPIFVNDLLGL